MATQAFADPAALLFGSYRRQVLALLLLHSDESFHLREIARLTGTQPGTLRRELSTLTDAGLLLRENLGNQARYRANTAFPIYEELRSILKKTAGVADILRGALSALGSQIIVAFIYGSIASGDEKRASDVDIMLVGTVAFEDVVRFIHPCQQQLRREINPHVYSPAEFGRKVRERNSFLSRVLARPKLFIVGSDDELGKLGADRKAESA